MTVLGQAGEDYLKCVYLLSLECDMVTPSMVAERFQISPAAVTKMVKRLKKLNLIRYERESGLELTASGKKTALEVLRHHRLIELYLFEALGYSWDQVHEEAERLEHVVSKRLAGKIDAALGSPTRDPHGAPIPGENGEIDMGCFPTLGDLSPGQEATIQRVNDEDASMLRYLGELGLYPGTDVKILSKEPFGGPFYVLAGGRRRIVGMELAENIMVQKKEMVK